MRRGAVIVAVVAAAAGVAHADPKGDRKLAERHFRAGERAYKAQNFGAAAANFEEAYKALPLPEIAFSAAQAYRRQYRVEPKLEYARRAVELYRIYLDQVKTGGRVGIAADSIGEMQREVDKLVAAGATAVREVSIERTRLGVSPLLAADQRTGGMREIADLPGEEDVALTTTIDGKPVPPFQMIDVEPGPHEIHVEAAGYLPHDSVERVVKGASAVAEVVLTPRPARVTIRTERGAELRIDGRAAGGAREPIELAAGKHVITIVRAGREPVTRELEVDRGEQLVIDAPLRKTARRRAVPWVASAAGVFGALTIAGVVYAVIEDGRASDQLAAIEAGDQAPGAADRYDQRIDRRDRAVNGALITGGAAVVLAGAAAALYWLDRPSDGGMRIAPTASTHGGGLSVVGRF